MDNELPKVELRGAPGRLKIKIPDPQQNSMLGAQENKYRSGGGSAELSKKLSCYPKEFTEEELGTPQRGAQADVKFVKIKTHSGEVVDIVRKKEKIDQNNTSVGNEIRISESIRKHPGYKKVRSSLSLPVHHEQRNSGDVTYSRLRKPGDLENYRDYLNKHSSDETTQHYLMDQTKKLTEALEFLHNETFEDEQGNFHKGIIHGDIKPDNILVHSNGNLSLSDLGCARFADEPIQQPGMLSYLPPEKLIQEAEQCLDQIQENSGKEDVWSLGVAVTSIVTGEYPIEPPPQQKEASSLAHTAIKEEKNASGYLVREETKQNARGYLVREEKQDPTGYITIETKQIDNSANFFSDNPQGRAIRKEKANEYLNSPRCAQHFESKKIIDDLSQKPFLSDSEKKEAFRHVTSMMLLPHETRSTASEAVKTMDKLAPHFPYNPQTTSDFAKKMVASQQQVSKKSAPPLAIKSEQEKERKKKKEELDRAMKLLEETKISDSDVQFKQNVHRVVHSSSRQGGFWQIPPQLEKEKIKESVKSPPRLTRS